MAIGERQPALSLPAADYDLVRPSGPNANHGLGMLRCRASPHYTCMPPCSKSSWVNISTPGAPSRKSCPTDVGCNPSPLSDHHDQINVRCACTRDRCFPQARHRAHTPTSESVAVLSFYQRTRLVAMFGNRNVTVLRMCVLLIRRTGYRWSEALYCTAEASDPKMGDRVNSDSSDLWMTGRI